MVAMTAVHFSFKSPCLKCLSRTLKRKPSVEVSSPRSSKETGKCLTKSGSACSPLMYLKLQLNKNSYSENKNSAKIWRFVLIFSTLLQLQTKSSNSEIYKSNRLWLNIFVFSVFSNSWCSSPEVKSKHSLPFQLGRGFAFFRRTIDLHFIPNVIAREASGNDRTFVR